MRTRRYLLFLNTHRLEPALGNGTQISHPARPEGHRFRAPESHLFYSSTDVGPCFALRTPPVPPVLPRRQVLAPLYRRTPPGSPHELDGHLDLGGACATSASGLNSVSRLCQFCGLCAILSERSSLQSPRRGRVRSMPRTFGVLGGCFRQVFLARCRGDIWARPER